MAFGNFPREKKKRKNKKEKTGNNSFSSNAPVFVLPRLIEKKKKQY